MILITEKGITTWPQRSYSVLQCAVRPGKNHEPSLAIIELLLKNGAITEYTHGNEQETVLHWAVQDGNIAVVELLLHYGAYVLAQDHLGRTALHDSDEDRCILFRQNLGDKAELWYSQLNRKTKDNWILLKEEFAKRYRTDEVDAARRRFQVSVGRLACSNRKPAPGHGQGLVDLYQEVDIGREGLGNIKSPRILLSTTRRISVGVTCTQANTIVLFEPQLLSNDEERAYSRINRTVQQRPRT